MDLSVEIAGVTLKNPVMTASGTFGSGEEYSEFVDLNKLGAVVTKGVANVPWPGNPTPRIAETYGGMLNAIGLQNPGIDVFVRRDIPFLKKFDTRIIVNVCGKTVEDYVEVELMVGEGVAGFTMEQWALAPLLYEVSLISPTGETVPRIPSQQAKSRELQFLFENTRVELDYATPEGATGNQLIFFRFVTPAPGLWSVRVYLLQGTSGMFQMYLPMEEMLTGEVYFLRSNPDTTILGPGNALRVITVGGYNDANGSIYLASGRGYTLEGNVKPDFVAPAVEVTGVNTSGDGRGTAARPTAAQYAPRTGTSAASAFTAAAAALYMEWDILRRGNVTASTVQVKNFLLRGTRQSENELYPNRQWGNGILDIYQAFRNLRL